MTRYCCQETQALEPGQITLLLLWARLDTVQCGPLVPIRFGQRERQDVQRRVLIAIMLGTTVRAGPLSYTCISFRSGYLVT